MYLVLWNWFKFPTVYKVSVILQALTKALTELRADMVTQAQENVNAHAVDAGQERNIQRLIDQHTKQMSVSVVTSLSVVINSTPSRCLWV